MVLKLLFYPGLISVLGHCFKFARADDLSNVARAAYEKFNTMTQQSDLPLLRRIKSCLELIVWLQAGKKSG